MNDQTSAREREQHLLDRCLLIARDEEGEAASTCEAAVFMLAAIVTESRFFTESERLRAVAKTYLTQHGIELSVDEAIKNGWIVSLPRLRPALRAVARGKGSRRRVITTSARARRCRGA